MRRAWRLLPFILKFLGGPLSDRFNLLGFGHRKPYIVIGLVVQSLGLLGLSLIHPADNLAGFTALALLTVAGLALYDTCCDGMVIDVTPPADRDRVQGMLVASRAAAAMLCTLAFGFLLEFTGNGPGRGDPVLWICAALGIIPVDSSVDRAGATARRGRRAISVASPERPAPSPFPGAAGIRCFLRAGWLRRRDQPRSVLQRGARISGSERSAPSARRVTSAA